MMGRGSFALRWALAAARGGGALPGTGPGAGQPCRGHRLTPAPDELYERTTLKRLERDPALGLFVDGYSSWGFTVNGDAVVGPCAIVPRAILQWNVGSYKDITEESLALFRLLEPRIEILVLGLGDKVQQLDPGVLKRVKDCGIAVEVQDTPNACATFNVLVSEWRVTAAALIPLLGVERALQ
uniref:NADH dehydrogenase [ubiquinone] 1 alpha subcomplex assembly factor 3 n=1 Tax=Pelusios castaneus TaxID=367368 RepID=A0A8C8T0E4_9SAUR